MMLPIVTDAEQSRCVLVVSMNLARAAEPAVMPFGMWTLYAQGTTLGAQISPWAGTLWGHAGACHDAQTCYGRCFQPYSPGGSTAAASGYQSVVAACSSCDW